MNNTAERLAGYYNFSPVVVERVVEVADVQRHYDHYSDYFNHLNLPKPRMFKGHQILDIRPTVDNDETKAVAYHLPMGNPLDPNMIYQAATVFAARPDIRLVAIGNP